MWSKVWGEGQRDGEWWTDWIPIIIVVPTGMVTGRVGGFWGGEEEQGDDDDDDDDGGGGGEGCSGTSITHPSLTTVLVTVGTTEYSLSASFSIAVVPTSLSRISDRGGMEEGEAQ